MNHPFKLLFAASALSLLAACGNNSSNTGAEASSKDATLTSATSAASSLTANAYRPAVATLGAAASPLKPFDPAVTPTATNVVLGAPLASQITTAQKNNATTAEDNMGKPLQIGFGREVAQTSTPAATQQLLKWKTTASGSQVAAINFNSTGAKGLRVGLLVTQLPETATLRFYAKGAATAFEVKGSEVLAVLAKNLAAGDKSEAGRTYWGPSVEGVDATVEIEIPAGVTTSNVSVSIPNVSHIFMSNKEVSTVVSQTTYSGDYNAGLTCQVDVKCSSPVPGATDSVVHLRFTLAGSAGTYICSGTLLNDNINSATPYILSANHCINSQTVASTLTTWFKYRSTTCNDGTTGEYYATTGGADLLYSAYATDSTLVKLRNSPAVSGVLYAGWDATTPPATSTAIHSIHHPKGDQQRLSRGTITGYSIRDTINAGSFPSSSITSGTILNVTLTTGLTEGGSSGSGLFKGTDANPIVIGQLYGGRTPGNLVIDPVTGAISYPPGCTAADPLVAIPPDNVYGRFDVAFNSGMKDWLVQGVRSVTQFFNSTTGMSFYTAGVTEGNAYAASNTSAVKTSTFKVSSIQTAGLSPVYRFYNTSNGSYFYTISEKERAAVASNTPRMRYDGIVWYASATAAASTVPVYSAFNSASGSQFFTTNSTERSNLIASNPQFKTDGIAFYVTP